MANDTRMRAKRSLGRKIYVLHRWHRQFMDERLARFGLGGAQAPFLMALIMEDGVTQEQLTDYVLVDKATTARAVRKLMELGYVRRVRDKDDRRAFRLFLTPRGRRVAKHVRESLHEWTVRLDSSLSPQERRTIRAILDKLVARAPRLEGSK